LGGVTGIVGVGVDVAEISRITAAIERRPRFVDRIYTPAEAAYCRRMKQPWRRFATRFAGKEAVMKSLGLGARGVNWTDIEILGRGKPEVRLAGKVAARAAALGVSRIEISLTHGEDTAIAVAVAVGA
jgi:holo-[acyl-carrier protein] synthase